MSSLSLPSPQQTIKPLATLNPPSTARTWHTAPHPYLPLAATSSSDKTVRIYSLLDFRLHSSVSGGHKRSIRTSAWKPGTKSAGESVLATGSFDASAGIWRRWDGGVKGMKEEQDFTGGFAGGGDDGLEGDGDGDDEDEEWRFAVVLDGHESEIKSVAWSAGGQYLATCSRDKSVWVWEEMEDDNFETVAVMQEHEGDVKCVAWHPTEELLASGSYDDTIRLYKEDLDDWTCVAIMNGHDATVWWVEFESEKVVGLENQEEVDGTDDMKEQRKIWLERRENAGARLISCSDDLSIRIWRRIPRERPDVPTGQGRMPSILRSNSIEEEWVEEARLPQRHERSVYTVSWSRKTGMVVSTGSDGKVVVYKERWKQSSSSAGPTDDNGDRAMSEGRNASNGHNNTTIAETEWIVVAEMSDAHDVFEVNHVCWAPRWDKGRRSEDEEMIMTTGDDGEVKAWILE
ncbi:WD40 repeat-like protein [Rhizodiscina lignyota]|uniref:Probable cytosolic iron-sulfur protein assembly protein 1 n=1 Tax=Rhizodiscina lignyota TaxID=1504668 RepID=A0A9P4IJI2_9PEZI|nr:WD40 repeat-like protein [Rhizodiscina lignyota]